MHAVDAAATIALFVVLLGWVALSVYAGAMSVTLSDSGAPGVAMVGVVLAIIGIPSAVIATYVAAVVSAWQADGYTFFYPLIALVAGTALAAVLAVAAFGLVRLGLRMHGTDADRSTAAGTAAPVAAPAVYTFVKVHDVRDGGLVVELGVERCSGRRYLRTPMPQRDGEYREYHGIDIAMYELFCDDAAAALAFAEQCRTGRHQDRWLPPDGAPAATPPSPGRTRLAGKRAILLTDHPTDASGAPARALPVGTPFVWIVDDRVDADGTLMVRAPGEDAEIVAVDARQLGLH